MSSAHVAQARVSAALTAGEVARLLRAGGLEVATPLAMGDRLGGCGITPGDRLGVFADAPQSGDFPSPVRTGGREVTIVLGERQISTGGRPTLTMGVPDPSEPPAPDIDLREVARGSRVNLLPGRCVILLFDARVGQWFAALAGGARVMIDEYELTQQPIPISTAHTLRFFTPLDDPATHPALAEIRLIVSAPQSETQTLPVGTTLLSLRFGVELSPFTLRASDNVRIGQIAAGLAKQTDIDLTDAAHVVRLRLAAPHLRITDLLPGEVLYAKL